MPLFDPDVLKRFHYLALVARKAGGRSLLDAPRKKLPAGGTEVTSLRDYAAGDDIRAVYWTWCARRDELLTKVFEGSGDLHLYVLLDCSASMGLGRPSKFHVARQIAAALGYVALLNLDRLGVAAFADGLLADLPLLRHKTRLPRLLRFLEQLKPQEGRTDLARAAAAFIRRCQRHGPVVVISDLVDDQGFERGLDILRFGGYEPRVLQIHDPRQLDPGLLGDVELLDVEGGTVQTATITERAARRYCALVAEFRQTVRRYCGRCSIPLLQVACDTPEDDLLLRALGGKPVKHPVQWR
ncbi:MAG: DUF58 domain-containing protein [Thermoguttaceae bacterium]|jgi:uncharacterized protein (DUF58 family)